MGENLRKTGIDIIGDVSWGTHFCQFYKTREDLVDILVPYFKAGLENNEFCMWITSKPLDTEGAKAELKKAVKDLDSYIHKGQIEILDSSEWYTKSGKFESNKVLEGWVEKENQAIKKGFDGLRLTGNTFWLEEKDWGDFTDYEKEINNVLGRYRMIALCSYALDKCGAVEIMDVVSKHQFALIKREGKWEIIQSSERKQAEEALKYQIDIEQLVLGISTDFINLPFDKIDDGLNGALKRIAEFSGAVRSSLFIFSEGLTTVTNTHEWCADPNDSQIAQLQRIPFETFGHYREKLLRFENVIIRRLNDLPPEAHGEREWIKNYGFRSLLFVPLIFERKLYGTLGFYGKVDEEIDWQEQYITLLKLISDIFVRAMERKRAEVALRQSEELYRSLVEGSIQGILIHQESIIQFANQSAARIFGYTGPDELVGKNLWEALVAPEEWAELNARNTSMMQGKPIPVHPGWQGIRKDGTRIWVQSTASLISWQNRPAGLSFYIDVTEAKQTMDALKESEDRYRTLVENVPIAVYRNTPGPKGKILMGNPACYRMFGFDSEEEFKHFSVADFYVNPKDRKTFSDNLLAQGSVSGVELALKKKDATPFWGSVTARVVNDERGKASYFDCTIVDVTARKQAEEEKEKLQAQLSQAKKVEAIGTIAGGIAHNFNNLLMTIIGNTSLMLLETDPDHPNYEKLKIIEKQVQSGSKLTSQLLGYAREGGYEVKPLSLNQLIKETSDTFAMTKKEIMVHRELAKDLFGIHADQDQIDQVLLNLYVNAADAMPGGGELFLKTMNVTHKVMRAKPYEIKPGNYVLLTVRDTGTGMDRKTQERLFDPFFTTKGMGRGTGLGLASVYGIIKAHGGYIDVKSKKGHGTTFSIYLPASSEKEVIEEKVLPKRLLKGKETILLVDDEDRVLDVGKEMLDALGYTVLLAKSGKEAVELYRKNKNKIDMVLLDMVMPEIRGGETYDRLKEINPDIEVLLSSGYSIDGQATEILKRGCDGFIQKPFDVQQLSQRIRKILDKK